MTTKEKPQKKKKGRSGQDLIGIRSFTKYGLATNKGELLFYLVSPTNISVLSHTNIEIKIRHLMMVLSAIPDSLRFGCRNKRRGCKAAPPRFTAARNADCKGDSALFRFADARGCKLPDFRLLGLHILQTPVPQPFCGGLHQKTARK